MTRIVLMHWHLAEAEARADQLRAMGYDVAIFAGGDIVAMRGLRDDPPDAFVIDLARTPSHGREMGVWLRGQAATRHVPLVFVSGEEEKVGRVRTLLPDAAYADWEHFDAALADAIAHPPARPVVPGTMDGYRGTLLPRKLGIGEGAVVALLAAPDGFERTLGDLPAGVVLRREASGPADVILLFATGQASLEVHFPAAASALASGGKLWIAWPKKASGVKSDLGEIEVRAYGLAHGFVDYKIAAIDATWSGLCFARRKAR